MSQPANRFQTGNIDILFPQWLCIASINSVVDCCVCGGSVPVGEPVAAVSSLTVDRDPFILCVGCLVAELSEKFLLIRRLGMNDGN